MTQASDSGRAANLLAAVAVTTADLVRAAADGATGRTDSDTAALVILTTTLNGVSQDVLGRVLGLTQPGSVRLVNRLTRAGLCERRPGHDGRTHAIVATTAGENLARDALTARRSVAEALLDVLDAPERERLSGLLEKLLAGMTHERADAFRICRLCDPSACGHDMGLCPVTRAAQRA